MADNKIYCVIGSDNVILNLSTDREKAQALTDSKNLRLRKKLWLQQNKDALLTILVANEGFMDNVINMCYGANKITEISELSLDGVVGETIYTMKQTTADVTEFVGGLVLPS